MGDALGYLMERGMTLEEIRRSMDKGLTLEELAAAASRLESRGELGGAVDPRVLVERLRGARNARELVCDAVKAAYRAAAPEQRGLLYGDLREIARAGRFAKEFDAVFSAFRAGVEGEKRSAAAKNAAAPVVSIDTVAQALEELGITVRYDQLLKEIEVRGLPDCYSAENAVNILPIYLCDHFRSAGCTGASLQAVEGYLHCIADKNRYNPIREYLTAGEWDGVDRFGEIYRILGVQQPRYQMYIRKWFIQCVALGLNGEGEKLVGAEGALVLQGEQGLAKTSFFRAISPRPRWFVEGAILDMRDKDSQIKALRGWICELGELDGTIKKEQSALKAFITQPEDRIRLPYARSETRSPRRTSFCGTVNPKEYLKDETGSRRFWTVPVTNVDKRALFSLTREWVDQLWRQALRLYREDAAGFRLTDGEIRDLQVYNRTFEQPLPYEMEILDLLDYTVPPDRWEWWRAAELARCLPGVADAKKVGKALAKIAKDYAPPNLPQFCKKSHGAPMYIIPLRHLTEKKAAAGERGEARGGENGS